MSKHVQTQNLFKVPFKNVQDWCQPAVGKGVVVDLCDLASPSVCHTAETLPPLLDQAGLELTTHQSDIHLAAFLTRQTSLNSDSSTEAANL